LLPVPVIVAVAPVPVIVTTFGGRLPTGRLPTGRRLVAAFWLLPTGRRLVAAFWLLPTGRRLVAAFWLLPTGWRLVAAFWLLPTGWRHLAGPLRVDGWNILFWFTAIWLRLWFLLWLRRGRLWGLKPGLRLLRRGRRVFSLLQRGHRLGFLLVD
jgi:hypothetical protein